MRWISWLTRRRGAGDALAAANRSMAIIEFNVDGRILSANDNFLACLGYRAEEILGRHHRMFVADDERDSPDYTTFWRRLAAGEFVGGRFRRVRKDGRPVWIEATYNPVLGRDGKTQRVIKFATDVTERVMREADNAGQTAALDRSMAVIEFDLQGHVLTANDNFLALTGYALDEVQGQHHRMFLEPAVAEGAAYRHFWPRLAHGDFHAGVYKRIAKDGRAVWINATYNPILDADGKPCKVVKFASDVTEQTVARANADGQLAAINKSMGVIEFALDGTVLSANDNFLQLVRYKRDEVIGRHHRMFVDADVAASEDYRQFWRKLASGQFDAGRYRRVGRGGREIWIRATYNPILDPDGRPFKVVKFAHDVTAQVLEAQRLQELLVRVAAVAEEVDVAVRQIATGNDDLSHRTERQAASLEDAASAIQELASTVGASAEQAQSASGLSHEARRIADEGSAQVADVVAIMGEIETASRSIGDIIGVIDGIAFQTNILALNAAVEAARAGEQGRGFAVVASEVRSLAQRCAASAREIRTLIHTASEKVSDGHQKAGRSGETMRQIVSAVASVNDLLAGLASACREQANGIDQISQSVASLDDVTQNNAALVEQVSAASQSLQEQAGGLRHTVSTYRDRAGDEKEAPLRQAVSA